MLQASVSSVAWGPQDSLNRANPSFLGLAKGDEAWVEVGEIPGGLPASGWSYLPILHRAGMELEEASGGQMDTLAFLGMASESLLDVISL